jgi:Golgi SNAP receptor complex protein 2
MDDLIGSGTAILTSLREQRSSLKGVHRKLLDLANTLGLSNSVIRMIERRAYEDKFVLWGGMLVTTVILFLIWKYFG